MTPMPTVFMSAPRVLRGEDRSEASLDALTKGLLFAFVGYVNWFPDICLEFTIQGIFVSNLRLPIF